MLEKIALLDSQTIRALIVAFVGVVGMICSFFGVSEAVFSSEKAEKLADGVATLVTLFGVLWAGWARATRPSPPLTEKAVEATKVAVAKGDLTSVPATPPKQQGGFARPLALAFLLAVSVATFGALAGCESLGLAAPQSYDQRVAYARGQLTGFVNATAAAVEKGQLAKDDGVRVLELAKQARSVLEAADVAQAAGDVSTAEGRLSLAIGILQQVQTFVERKQP